MGRTGHKCEGALLAHAEGVQPGPKVPATLAALQGAMSMAAGTPSAPTLQEGFDLLDWLHRECA